MDIIYNQPPFIIYYGFKYCFKYCLIMTLTLRNPQANIMQFSGIEPKSDYRLFQKFHFFPGLGFEPKYISHPMANSVTEPLPLVRNA
jgi:hypothetical protein